MRFPLITVLLLAQAWAAPLLLQQDLTPQLSRSFLLSRFCQQYGCAFKERLNSRRTYQTGKATIQVETMGGNLRWLVLYLPHPQKPLSTPTLKLFADLIRSSLGFVPGYDLGKYCLETAQNPGQAVLRPRQLFTGLLKGRTIYVGCLWDDGIYPTAGNFPPKIQLMIGYLL
jgi:hypothetical protein